MKKILSLFTALVITAALSLSVAACNPSGGSRNNDGEANYTSVDFDGVEKKIKTNYSVELIEGTNGTWSESTVDGETVLTFSALNADSVYKLKGSLAGSIVLNGGDEHKLELELGGFTVASEKNCPISALSGDKITLTAKKGTQNFVLDRRGNVSMNAEQEDYAIYSETDLTFGGQGVLTVVSENNGGVQTKDDLEVKKLTLNVKSADCAMKGNDGVSFISGASTLVSTRNDGIKTSNSQLSGKGNQKGKVEILGGSVDVYCAGDGIDSAYDVDVSGYAALNVYTDKYSAYSEEITAVSEGFYLLRANTDTYRYSIMYYNSESDVVWKNAVYDTYTISVSSSGKTKTRYYYKADKLDGYDRFRVYAYNASQQAGQGENFVARSDGKAQNDNYDTISVSVVGKNISTSWTNFTTATDTGNGVKIDPVEEGDADRGDYSSKGIKADNAVNISGGTVKIIAYDDAIHADNGSSLDNGAEPLGNVTISLGSVTVYSNDDAIHADGVLTVSGGNVSVMRGYEGAEASEILVTGGNFTVIADDDGINASADEGAAIKVTGGKVYVRSGGDGIDSNSKTSFGGISFEGGNVVIISTSPNNSCIDSEAGYSYSGGRVIGVCPKATSAQASVVQLVSGTKTVGDYDLSLSKDGYVTASGIVSVRIPADISDAFVIYLGDGEVTLLNSSAPIGAEDGNGVCWKN